MARDPVHFSAVIAREAPRPQSFLPVIAAGLLVLVGFIALLFASRPYASAGPAVEEPYNLVVEGFRSGHVWLAKDPPAALLSAPNPYDFATYRRYLADPWGLTDLSYYKGHLYAYFGVTPAVVVFWPFRVLTGEWLHQSVVVLMFCVLGYAVSVGLAVAARRRYYPEAGPLSEATIALLLGSVTTLPVFLVRPGLYEVSISCGFAFTMLSLAALWNAWHRAKGVAAWLAAASLCYGLAVGSRPSLLFGAVVLFVPAAASLWAALNEREPAPWARYFLAALIPYLGGRRGSGRLQLFPFRGPAPVRPRLPAFRQQRLRDKVIRGAFLLGEFPDVFPGFAPLAPGVSIRLGAAFPDAAARASPD